MNIVQLYRFNKRAAFYIRMASVLLFIGIVTYTLYAHSTGMTGATNSGCTCHGSANSNTSISVTSENSSFTMNPNETRNFTITLSNSARQYCGIDIAVKTSPTGETNAGSLSPGAGLQLSGGELTHTSPKNYSGSASFAFSWTAPSTPGTYYIKVAGNAVNNDGTTNGDQWNFMSAQAITVTAPPSVTVLTPNGSESYCPGSATNITWTSVSITNVKIELSADGGSSYPTLLVASVAASSGSWNWNVPFDLSQGSQYKVRISDASNPATSDESNSVFSIGGPVSITAQPQSLNTCTGQQVQFSVSATGGGLSYKWKKDGTDVPGGTNSTLTLSNVTTAMAGSYNCIVNGACGSPQTSSSAVLTVDITPSITVQPQPKTVCQGDNTSFTITAVGTDIQYQWRKDANNIPGETTSTLVLQNITPDLAGHYDCVVSGKCSPPATSNTAMLTVGAPPAISLQPKPVITCIGSKAEFTLNASGSSLSYKWYRNGIEIPLQTTGKLTIASVTANDLGYYYASVSGTCPPAIRSDSVLLSIYQTTKISNKLEDQTVNEGQSIVLSITALGDSLSYQWRKNRQNLDGKIASKLTINPAKLSDSGSYDCLVRGECGSDSSNSIKLKVIPLGSGPVLALTVPSVDFGNVEINHSKDSTLTGLIKNIGNQSLTISKIYIDGLDSSDFSINTSNLPLVLQQGEMYSLPITFAPKSSSAKTAHIEFVSNAVVSPKLDLSGFAMDLTLGLSAKEIDFVVQSTKDSITNSVSLTNNGNIDMHIALSLTGEKKSSFVLLTDSVITLAKGANSLTTLQYRSSDATASDAILNLLIKESGKALQIPLRGQLAASVNDYLSVGGLRFYPNPVRKTINIDFDLNSVANVDINIYSITGILQKSFTNIQGREGMNSITWDSRDADDNYCPEGNYLVIVSIGGNRMSFPLVISR